MSKQQLYVPSTNETYKSRNRKAEITQPFRSCVSASPKSVHHQSLGLHHVQRLAAFVPLVPWTASFHQYWSLPNEQVVWVDLRSRA